MRALFLLAIAVVWSAALPSGAALYVLQDVLQSDDGLFTRQFSARNLVVQAEDLALTLTDGTVLVGERRGLTTLVLIGKGVMRFSPIPEAEKSQIRLLRGSDALESPFDVAVVRTTNPGAHANLSPLVPLPMDERMVRRSYDAFPDLSLSPESYGSAFGPRDFVGDVRTSRVGHVRYLRSEAALEAISLVDRASGKTLSIYPSADQRAARGRSFREDEHVQYDVLHHDLSLSYEPERRFIDAVAAMRVRITAEQVSQLSFRLAANLQVRSITAPGLGSLPAARSANQESIVLSAPSPLTRGTEVTIVVSYSGAISPPAAEWEMPAAPGAPPLPALEHAQLTSTFPMWYPRPPFIDFATATMRISVPAAFDCVATGDGEPGSPLLEGAGPTARKLFTFGARQPVRHLAFLVAPFTSVNRLMLTVDDGPPGTTEAMPLATVVQLRSRIDAQANAKAAADIVQFYRSIIGNVPYPSLTLALVDGQVPGGHSAAYFSVLGAPPPGTNAFWRNDPVVYDSFPNFVLAHEIAHQWWGQVVGWSSYHDQWMTEAFAQYFATLHTGQQSGPASVGEILQRMRTWAMSESSKGPLSLGPRLGVIQNDDRVFRALLYNKGPAVLHMLRRLVGDTAFFEGTRKFYAEQRFRKPSTDDLRRAMEAASGRALERFFDLWIYGSALPRLRFTYRGEQGTGGNGSVLLRVEQIGDLFDLPVTIVLQYADGTTAEETLKISERTTEVRVPLTGRLRRAEVSRSDGTLADIR